MALRATPTRPILRHNTAIVVPTTARGDWITLLSTMPLSRSDFEALVARALRGLPRRFRKRLQNVAVVVEDRPDRETLNEMGIQPPETLYGLYRGVSLDRRGAGYGGVLPDSITIFQGPIEEDCKDFEEMETLVQDVVIHEIGHYFGLDDARLEELENPEE